MTWLLAVFLIQDPASQADQIRASMAASIEKQRASVRLQAQTAGANSSVDLDANAPEAKNSMLAIVGRLISHIVP